MKTFLAFFNALPAILQTVQAVETAIPLPQAGQQKLNLILNAAGAAWEVGQAAEGISKGNVISGIQNLTNVTVASLNAAGVFKHSAPAATAPVVSK